MTPSLAKEKPKDCAIILEGGMNHLYTTEYANILQL